ncbi:MAG: ATP-binding cassette domain-containing protein [Planctomycetia bacterium]|nr:ATP-binding cassette domain-containing protein [Planctomycetia bacterium]
MLELSGVSKSYDGRIILQPTSLTVAPGETVVLIGPSGCGKSTLLRIIVGLVSPDAGTVWLDGEQLTEQTLLRLRSRFGYVLQDGGLFPHLTGRDNVAIMADYLNWDQRRIQTRVAELAHLVRLPLELLARYPTQMSGGQRQRVGIMRALMLDPSVVLLDEPMGALDPLVRADLQQDLKDIFDRLKKVVVMVTHDMGEAGFFADRILLLGEGRVVQAGSLDDFIHRPANDFVRRFITAQRLLTLAGVNP